MLRNGAVRMGLGCLAACLLAACGEPPVTPDPANSGPGVAGSEAVPSRGPGPETSASTAPRAKEGSLDETIKAVDGKDPAPLLTLLGFAPDEVKALSDAKAMTGRTTKLQGNFDADPDPEMALWVEVVVSLPPMQVQNVEMVVFFDGTGPSAKPVARDALKLDPACVPSFEVTAEKLTSDAVDSVVGRSILTIPCDGRYISGKTGIFAWSSQPSPRILALEEEWQYDRAGEPEGQSLKVDVEGAPPKVAKVIRKGKVKKQLKYDAKAARYK